MTRRVDLVAVWARWEAAVAAKPKHGPITDYTPIIDSACDVPDLARELEQARARIQVLEQEVATHGR